MTGTYESRRIAPTEINCKQGRGDEELVIILQLFLYRLSKVWQQPSASPPPPSQRHQRSAVCPPRTLSSQCWSGWSGTSPGASPAPTRWPSTRPWERPGTPYRCKCPTRSRRGLPPSPRRLWRRIKRRQGPNPVKTAPKLHLLWNILLQWIKAVLVTAFGLVSV